MNSSIRFPDIVLTIEEGNQFGILHPDLFVALELERRGVDHETVNVFRRAANGGACPDDYDASRRRTGRRVRRAKMKGKMTHRELLEYEQSKLAYERVKNKQYMNYRERLKVCQQWVVIRSDVWFVSRFLNDDEKQTSP